MGLMANTQRSGTHGAGNHVSSHLLVRVPPQRVSHQPLCQGPPNAPGPWALSDCPARGWPRCLSSDTDILLDKQQG